MVPEGWNQVSLGEYANYITSGSRGWAEYYADDGDVFVRITNLRRSSISPDWYDTKHVRLPVGMKEGTRTRLVRDDILISITADLGIVGFIEHEPAIPHYINQHVALVRSTRPDINPKFVAYYLASDFMQKSMSALNDAGIKAGLNLPTIRSVNIAFPPLPEQQKIAEILSVWDKAIQTTEALLANARTQKRALMQALLTGTRRFPGFEGQPWREVRLGDVASLVTKGTTPTTMGFEFTDQGISFIKAENVEGSGRVSQSSVYVSLECHDAFRRSQLQSGDILVTIAGAIGRVGLVLTTMLPANTNQAVAIIRIPEESDISRSFVSIWLQGPRVQTILRNSAAGGAQPNINLAQLSDLPIRCPDTTEQDLIVQAIDDASRCVEVCLTQLEHLRTEKKSLMQQLLTGKRRVVV